MTDHLSQLRQVLSMDAQSAPPRPKGIFTVAITFPATKVVTIELAEDDDEQTAVDETIDALAKANATIAIADMNIDAAEYDFKECLNQAALDHWDELYGNTHNWDGTPVSSSGEDDDEDDGPIDYDFDPDDDFDGPYHDEPY